MRIASLLVLAACGGHSNPVATDAPPGPDATPIDASSDAPSTTAPAVLVPASLGNVVDFAYTPDALFPILNIGGHFQLVSCPQQVCGASPTMIGAVGTSTRGRGVEIVGDHIYWLASATQLMEAALDGSGANVRYDSNDGTIEPHLRHDGTTLYFDYTPTNFLTVALALDTATSDPPQPVPNTQASATAFLDTLDVSHGTLAVWRSQQGTAPQPITVVDLATGTATPMGAAMDVPSIAVATGGVYFVSEFTSTEELHACSTSPCTDSPKVANTFFQVAAVGDRGFFPGRTPANVSTIVSCDLATAAAGTCTPRIEATPASELDLLNVRALRADADAIYVATDANGAASVWKIAR
jgi:hypothetical protein